MELQNKQNLSIIDIDHALYLICYNKKDSLLDKTLDDVYKGLDDYMKYLLVKTKADKYISFLSPKKTFRNDINPLYKANRKPSEINYLTEAKEYLKDKWKAIQIEGLESDDCCLILENKLKNNYNIVVISPDKDIRYTEGYRFDPKKGEFITTNKDDANRYFWTSMISGDTADNIKGIPGKGDRYAEKLFEDADTFEDKVLMAYINICGQDKGIKEFYKNYMSLKILIEHVDFNIDEKDLSEYNKI